MNNVLNNLKTTSLGRKFIFFETIDSTQLEIWRRVRNKTIENGTIVMANLQTNGKGTHGRIWHTDEKDNIAFSFYIETNNSKLKNFENITVDIAEILVQIFQSEYNIKLDIKKPNDLMINNKKVGGILTESKVNAGKIKFLVVGIGINTSKTFFTKDIEDIATSMKKEFGTQIDRLKIISEFCNRFEEAISERIKSKI